MLELYNITNISDRLEKAKDTGYRGYKMNISYSMPTINGPKAISSEVLIRTMIMDAWSLHDDRVYNNESVPYKTTRQLQGLSPALTGIERELVDIKNNFNGESNQQDLLTPVNDYLEKKKTQSKKLLLVKDEA